MKRNLAVFVVLFIFGGWTFSLGGQMQHRPDWAQGGMVAMLALIACIFVFALFAEPDTYESNVKRMHDAMVRSQAASPDDPAAPPPAV